MYRASGFGYELGEPMDMSRPEVGGTYWEYGFGYGGEQGLGLSLKGIVRGIGKGIKGVAKVATAPVRFAGKTAFKGAKFVAKKAVVPAAKFVAKHPLEVAAVAAGAPLTALAAKKGIGLLKQKKRTTAPDQTGAEAEAAFQRAQPPTAADQKRRKKARDFLAKMKPQVVEDMTGTAKEKPSLTDIGKQAAEQLLSQAAGGVTGGGPGGGPMTAPEAAPEAGAEEAPAVKEAGFLGMGGAALPILLASGVGLFLLSRGGGGGGGRRHVSR